MVRTRGLYVKKHSIYNSHHARTLLGDLFDVTLKRQRGDAETDRDADTDTHPNDDAGPIPVSVANA